MIQATLKTLLGLAIVMGTLVVARAEEDKAKEDKVVTLKGELGCPKCVFEVASAKKCGNAIKVKVGDKETVYLLIDKGGAEKYHGAICKETKKGSVKGVVSKKGDQQYITPAKDGVKFDE